MKTNFFYFLLIILNISCVNIDNSEIKNSNDSIIGSAIMDGTNSMTPLMIGDTENQKIWLEYIKAHNDKDLDKIAEINAEDWEGYTADGSVVKGTKAHIEILDNWFKTANPKWEVKWMIANAAKNKDGEIEQWLTTGNDYTDIDSDGNEVFEYNVHDVLFEKGKIKKINVYKRAKEEESAEFSY